MTPRAGVARAFASRHTHSACVAVVATVGLTALTWLMRKLLPESSHAAITFVATLGMLFSIYTAGKRRATSHNPAADDPHGHDERFRLVVEAAPNAVVVTNAKGLIEIVNSQTETWFGYTRAELIGQPGEMLLPERFRVQYREERAAYLRDPQRRSLGVGREFTGLRRDGSEFPLEIGLNPIKTEHDILVLAVIVDISQQRTAEQQLKVQAKEIAAASRYKSEFLANMSHELRTPLNSILLLSEQLRENRQGNLTSKQVEHANIVYRSGSDLLALINDILDLSKIEAGRMSVSTEKVVVNHFVEELRLAFTPLADERGLKFSVSVADAPAVIVTDRHRMYQIVRNLVSNALKFTEAGMVHVRVFTPRQDIPAALAALSEPLFAVSVTDTGPGIPKDKQQTIFEAFRQLDASLSRQHGGTGLGLTISRQIADLLGGVITVSSQVGLGSTFTLYMPARLVTASKENERETRFVELAKTLRGTAPRVLIVDNDPDSAQLLATLAQENGIEPVIVGTVAAALKQARHTPPDALVLETSLPDGSGWDLLAQLRKLPRAAHMPVYALSSNNAPLPRQTYGIKDYLVKPVDRARLTRVFANLDAELLRSSRLLLLADEPDVRARLERFFAARGFQVVACADVVSAETALARGGFRILVIDASDAAIVEHFVEYIISQPGDDLRLMVHAHNPSPALRRRLTDLDATLLEHDAGDSAWATHLDYVLSAHAAPAPAQRRRVLVVDDDIRNTYALCSTFDDLQVDVVTAHNGAEALELMRREKNKVDMVFMDIAMPVMDGYEAMRRLKQEIQYTGPVVALTAYAMKGDREKCLAAGADDYLAKPVSRSEITLLLEKWFTNPVSREHHDLSDHDHRRTG